MRSKFLGIGLVSTAFLSTLVPVTRAFPKFLQPAKNKDATYGRYTWPGYGPAPTLSSSSVSTLFVATSEDSGAETSTSGLSISAISGTSLGSFSGAPHSTKTSPTSYTESPVYSSIAPTSPSSLVTSTIMYISSSRAFPTSSKSVSSSGGGKATSLQNGTTSNRYSTISAASTSTIYPLKCNHDNCLRQIIRASTIAADFCVMYITAVNTISTDLPTFVSNCKNSPSRISSACSCVISGPTTSTPLVSTSLSENSNSEGSKTVSSQPSQTSGGLVASSSQGESSSKTLHPSSNIFRNLTSITESTSAASSVTLPQNVSSSNSKSQHRTSHRPSFSMIYSSGLSASGNPIKSSPSAPYPTSNLTSPRTSSSDPIASGGLSWPSKTKTHHRSHHTHLSATPPSSRLQPSRSVLPGPSTASPTSNTSLIVPTATGVSSSMFSNFSTSLYRQNVSSTVSGVGGSTSASVALSSTTTPPYPFGNSSTIISSNGVLSPTSSFPMISVGPLTTWKSSIAGGVFSFVQSSSVFYPTNSTLLISSSIGTGNIQPPSSVSVGTSLSYAGGGTSSTVPFPTTNSSIILPTSSGVLHASTSLSPYTSGTRNVTSASHPLSHRSKVNHNMTTRKASSTHAVGNSGTSRSKAHTLTKTGTSGGIVSSTYESSAPFSTLNQTHSSGPTGNPAFFSTLNNGASTSLSLPPSGAPYNSTYNSGPTGSLLFSSSPIFSHSPASYSRSTSSPSGTTCKLNHSSLLPTGLSSTSAVTSLETSSNQTFSTLLSSSFTAAGASSSFSSSQELMITIKLTSAVVSTLATSVRTSSYLLGNLSMSSYIPPTSSAQTSDVVSSFLASSSNALGYSGTNGTSILPSTTSENSGLATSLSSYTPEGSSAPPITPSYPGATALSMHQFPPPLHRIKDEHHRHSGQEGYVEHGHGHEDHRPAVRG